MWAVCKLKQNFPKFSPFRLKSSTFCKSPVCKSLATYYNKITRIPCYMSFACLQVATRTLLTELNLKMCLKFKPPYNRKSNTCDSPAASCLSQNTVATYITNSVSCSFQVFKVWMTLICLLQKLIKIFVILRYPLNLQKTRK